MNCVHYQLKPLNMEISQLKEVLYILFNSILFQRELGQTIPFQRESQMLNIVYLACDDMQSDKYIQDKLQEFEDYVVKKGQLECEINLILFTTKQKKSFLFYKQTEKIPFEMWSIQVQVMPQFFEVKTEEERKQRLSNLSEGVKERLLDIISKINERFDHIPNFETQEDVAITYPYEINFGKNEGGLMEYILKNPMIIHNNS